MAHQDNVGYVGRWVFITVSVNWGGGGGERESSKPAREFLHLPHIFRHYLYMHAQPS